MPIFTFKKGDLKKEIKRATYSFCYMCPDKFNCSDESKHVRHCMNYKRAQEINKAIDLAYEVVKEAKKDERKNE